jgi:tyrosinase
MLPFLEGVATDEDFSLLSRRELLKSSSALAVMIATGGCDQILNQIKNRPTRRNISSLAANDPIIQSYQAAITKMKALPSTDTRNWTNQALIHNNHCPHGNWFFLPWHREYLLYFERICRQLSGNKTFALPYWNWAVESKVPDIFWGAGNPMFDSNRVMTQGTPLDQGSIGHAVMEGIQSEPNFLLFGSGKATTQRGFAVYGELEQTPHNYVHGAIGGDMGAFMSPLDPVFWCHHNMIEYCWVDWNLIRQHDNTSDPAWNNFTFSDFFDENGNAVPSLAVAIGLLYPIFDYQYEPSQIGQTVDQLKLTTRAEADKLKKFVQTGANVEIAVLRRFPLSRPATVELGKTVTRTIPVDAAPIRAALESQSEQRLLLTVGGVQQPAQNDFFVRVFVNLPSASAETPISDPHYGGSFAFFLGDHAARGDNMPKLGFVVDITQTLRRLNAAGSLASLDRVDLQLVPVPFPGRRPAAAASFSLEQLELASSRITSN